MPEYLDTSTTASAVANESYDPKPLEMASPSHNQLHRLASNSSGVSRILEGIKDDHELDNEEYAVKSAIPVAEEAIQDELERVSRQLTLQSREKAPSIQSLGESLPEEEPEVNDHPIDGLFAIWQAVLAMLWFF